MNNPRDGFFRKSCPRDGFVTTSVVHSEGFHHVPKHQKGASDQSTLVIGFA